MWLLYIISHQVKGTLSYIEDGQTRARRENKAGWISACKVHRIRTGDLASARGERAARTSEGEETEGEQRERRQRRRKNLEREREGDTADRGIIIKRDISYVGGRIVSATRHARRFCVLARSCAACALNKGHTCACMRPRYIHAHVRSRARLIRRKAPRAMWVRAGPGALSALCKSVGPICVRGSSPCAKERKKEREKRARAAAPASKAVPPPPPPR